MSQDPFDVILRCRRCPSGGGSVGGRGWQELYSTYIGHWTHHSHLALSVHLERDQHVCIDLHILNPIN